MSRIGLALVYFFGFEVGNNEIGAGLNKMTCGNTGRGKIGIKARLDICINCSLCVYDQLSVGGYNEWTESEI